MKIHFVGIGGIGISALAVYYLKKGNQVSGSDLSSSEMTISLKKMGAKIYLGKHNQKNLSKKTDLVIFSPAIKRDNPELEKARELGIKTQSYPQSLGQLTKQYFSIAVAGTHGKSTTAAIAGLLLIRAGFDPTVILGTRLKEFNNMNCRIGKSNYLVIEADEYKDSFLNYFPQVIILTSIDNDHLDFFRDLNHVLKSFKRFIKNLSPKGILITNKDDRNIRSLLNNKENIPQSIIYYFQKQKEVKRIKNILKIPGLFNVSNALAVLALSRSLGIPDKVFFKTISEYRGSWRRFEIKKTTIRNRKITIISDYAHHPTEIEATLKACREKYPQKKIWTVFQPHQYQRTFYLFKDFIRVLFRAPVDKLIIVDIFDVPGRENSKIREIVSSQKIVDEINKKNKANKETLYIPSIENVLDYLKKNLKGGEVVMVMGAGDIYHLVKHLTKK